jgi:hypothetical protein
MSRSAGDAGAGPAPSISTLTTPDVMVAPWFVLATDHGAICEVSNAGLVSSCWARQLAAIPSVHADETTVLWAIIRMPPDSAGRAGPF